MRRRLVSLCAALVLSAGAAGARPRPTPAASPAAICAFRLGTLQTLFAAANEVGLAQRVLGGADPAPAAAGLAAALGLLDAEKRRVAAEGRSYLGKKERRSLVRALRAARKPTKQAALRAGRRPAADVAALATRAGEAIGVLLAASSDAYGGLTCAGGELRVAHLLVSATETRSVPGASAIVAEDGIELLGHLVMAGTPADGLTLVAESGDLVLEGSIDARGTAPASGAAALAPLGASVRAALRPRGAEPPSCGDGGDVFVTADTGNLRIGASFFALGGDGADCAPLEVSDASQLLQSPHAADLFEGRAGGKGGDMVVAAPLGNVRFAPRPADDPGPFSPGSGGAGQDLTFSPRFVPPGPFPDPMGKPNVRFNAGSGGSSGRLRLHGALVDTAPLPRLYGIGDGGRGGSLRWELASGEWLFPSGTEEIVVSGGWGGTGVVRGGRGGDTRYEGDRIVNRPGEPVTGVVAIGGFGGGVHGDVARGPEDLVVGGDGGHGEATGHAGWHADATHAEAGTGGRAVVGGGFAHAFSDLPDHPKSAAGRGGDARGRGGRGGNGRPSCEDPPGPGGSGGRGGSVRVVGGGGGDAPGGRGRAGDGGSVLFAETGSPGVGGDGSPPGACGLVAERAESVPGDGGTGLVLGAQGEAVEVLSTGCEGDDVATCDEVPDPDPDPGSCPRVYTSTVNVHTVHDSGLDINAAYLDSGAQECTGARCVWNRAGSGTTTTVQPNGRTETTSFSYADEFLDIPGYPHAHNFVMHCSPSGELHLPGSGGIDHTERPGSEITLTHSCAGCECLSRIIGNPVCCPCEDCPGGWNFGDGSCP
jgi:hypothetical protein